MPPTVMVNGLSAVHKGSTGMTQAFPDVCNTPAPPSPSPVPIPYPNIAMSSDAGPAAMTVSFQAMIVMVKGSKFLLSTGDEAGVAMGVTSGMIKGTAEFVSYSFNVKAAGQNVCRMLDPVQQNMSGSGNAMGPAEMQPPGVP